MASAAVNLQGAAVAAFDGVDYAYKLRRDLRAGGGSAGAVYAPWLVGNVAGQDAPDASGSKPLTTGYIVGTTGLQRADIARFGPLGSIAAEPMPPGAEGPTLHLVPAPPGANDAPAAARPWEAGVIFGHGQRDPAVGNTAQRSRTRDAELERGDLTKPPLPPLLPRSEDGDGFSAAAATAGQAGASRANAGDERRFWTGTEFVPVKGQSVDQLLMKIIASDSLLDEVRQSRAAAPDARASIEVPMQTTVGLSGHGPLHGLQGRPGAAGGAAMYLSPIRASLDARA